MSDKVGYGHRVLEKLCRISSMPSDIFGVNQVQQEIAKELMTLGFEVRFLAHPDGRTGDMLHGSLNVPVSGVSKLVVAIVCHADCVQPWQEDDQLRRENGLLIGPGVADDKGGITVALSGLRSFLLESSKGEDSESLEIHFVCSPSEELGSIGFHDFYAELGARCTHVFGFEPALESGAPIAKRFGNRWYRIQVTGESSHSGRVGRAERNAAHELSAKIAQLHEFHDPENEVKLNVGSLSGGSGQFNTTCGWAEALVDARFSCPDVRDDLHQRIVEVLRNNRVTQSEHVKCEWKIEDDCPPLAPTPASERFVEFHLAMIREIEGQSVELEATGGAADVNYFCHADAVTIDGLGPVGLRLHRRDEAIIESTLETRSEVFRKILALAASRQI